MNAHDLKQQPIEWTSGQKYQRLRKRDLIEVRLIATAGVPERWHEARIESTNPGGAFAELTSGRMKRFFHWKDIRKSEAPDTNKPIASFAEIAKGQLPALPAEPAPQKPLPVFAAPAPAPAPAAALPTPPAAPQPPLVLLRAARETLPMPADKNSRTPHPQTDGQGRVLTVDGRARSLPNRHSNDPRAIGSRVGALIQETRKTRGITQLGLADRSTQKSKGRQGSAVYNSRVSQIELGKTLPTDDELLAIAEALDLSLDAMIELRDTDQSERAAEANNRRELAEREREKAERAAREARDAVRRQSVIPNATRPYEPQAQAQTPAPQNMYRPPAPTYYEPPPAPPEQQRLVNVRQPTPAPIVAMQIEFAGFVESVVALVPMPGDSELRKRWFACVMELYKLSGSQS
jgi:transcriptional regulator with XRE-family HTH domain